jgi:hypothetical protein
VEQKRSYPDRGILNALVAQAKLYARVHRKPLLLLARYIPRPSAERLIESRINFVDQAGNMHLVLGQNYERTIIGNKENAVSKEGKRVSPAIAQLLFTFATKELAGSWSVRQLAEVSGLSNPQNGEFQPRTMWSLSNAFTSAFKGLDPIPQFRSTAKLGSFLEAVSPTARRR